MPTDVDTSVKEYEATLSELKTISKVEINGLTMLAEENRDDAVAIATCIENQLKSAPTDRKLPILYLIDSICKNCKNSRYVELFTQNIVSNFCNVYKTANESVRRGLLKLRKSWAEANMRIFPQIKLDAIDERVRKIDPNWPCIPNNPTMMNNNNKNQNVQLQQHTQQSQAAISSTPINQVNNIAVNSYGNNQNQINMIIPNNNNIITNNNINNHSTIQTRGSLKRALGNNGNSAQNNIGKNLRGKRARVNNGSQQTQPQQTQQQTQQQQQPLPIDMQQQLLQPQPPLPFITIPQPQAQATLPFIALPQIQPISQLPQQQSIPIIAMAPPGTTQATQIVQQQQSATNNTNNGSTTKSQNDETDPILMSLYERKQCSSCCLRFDDNDPEYAAHLDWHYNQNSNTGTEVARRKFYYPIYLWTNDDDQKPTESEITNEPEEVNDYSVQKALAPDDEEKNKCSVCHEKFDKEWCESDEEWKLLNALAHNDEFYHPSCFKDVVLRTTTTTGANPMTATATTRMTTAR